MLNNLNQIDIITKSNFFLINTYILDFLPNIKDDILLNTPVKSINYESDKVTITTYDSQLFEAKKVLVTIPVSQF